MSEYRCDGCGYGATALRLPRACPMCGSSVWTPVLGRKATSVRVASGRSAAAVITLTREPQIGDLGALSSTVAALAHDAPEIVVDLTCVSNLPEGAAELLLRLDALARGAGGHLRARCAAGVRPATVVELDVERGRALAELDGPVGHAFRHVVHDA